MRLCQATVRQRVVAVVELGEIATEILRDHKFAARVDPLIPVCSQDKIVADAQGITFANSLFNLSWCP